MRLWLGIASLLLLFNGTVSDGFDFDLSDALDDGPTPTPPPKVPEKPKSDGDDIPDILDFGPPKTTKKPPGGDDIGLDLGDALGPDPDPKPNQPAVNPDRTGGGGGSFGLDDLADAAGSDYQPDKGKGGSRPQDPGYDPHGGAGDQPQEAGSGQIAGIASAIGVALLGAASSYFAYQKKKLCFKLQGGVDPESGKGHHGTQSEPQVLSNLLRSS